MGSLEEQELDNFLSVTRPSSMDEFIYGDQTDTIYVLWDGVSIKIGRSKNIESRVRSLQTGHDKEICVFWAVRVSPADAIVVERAIHSSLRSTISHKHGEWYGLDPHTGVGVIKANLRKMKVLSKPDIAFGFPEARF